jgi:hypothetical protein
MLHPSVYQPICSITSIIKLPDPKTISQRKQQLAKSRWCSWLSRGSHITMYDCSQSRNPKAASSSLARDKIDFFCGFLRSMRLDNSGMMWLGTVHFLFAGRVAATATLLSTLLPIILQALSGVTFRLC